MQLRTGNGIDFHRLILDQNRPLMLGGVEIPGELSLSGHSDADIVLHALCDAIGGALSAGDIGEHFPDNDEKNKNRDSVAFLDFYLDLMKKKGYSFMNIDITIIGERPKILPHRKKIIQKLSELCSLESDRIGLKATTTEKMGALGREEGLACMANILLYQV